MIRRHEHRRLGAYSQGRLAPELARRVADHLSGCPACRAELEEIRFGMQLAASIAATPAPPGLWTSIERALDGGAALPVRAAHPARRRVLAAAASLLVVSGALAWYATRPRVRLQEAPSPPSAIERAAVAEHDLRLRGEAIWELPSAEVPRIRRWIEEGSGLSASIPAVRPPDDQGRLRFVGARLARIGSARAAVIGYEIDAHPVTLVTARLSDLADPPREGRFSKHIFFRPLSRDGRSVLTWGSDGQAYAMVSDLPDNGREGCFACHTDPRRRDLIRAMHLRADR